jgi:hypothetical protein
MNQHGKGRPGVALAVCRHCSDIHLVITEAGQTVVSVGLSREEWSKLLGTYGDMLTLQSGGSTH